MAEGLNRVILLGNVGTDPELKMTQGGTAVLKLRLATTERYVDRNGTRQERTEWHSVTVWGKRGEALHKYISKGSRLLVEGSLRTSSYDDRDGNKRYRTEVIASNVVFAGASATSRDRKPLPTDGLDEPGANRFVDDQDFGAPGMMDSADKFPNDDDVPF